MEFCSDNTL